MREIGKWIGIGLVASLPQPGFGQEPDAAVRRIADQRVVRPAEGLSWPAGQALPTFAAPAEVLDTVVVQDLSEDEQITFSALQGQVNRTRPRLLMLDARAGEGRDTWPKTLGLEMNFYSRTTKWDLLRKYAGDVRGVVLHDPEKSPHYRNLAGTVAALRQAIPATPAVVAEMEKHGISLPVVEDLTTLGYTTPLEIYGHLHERYWPECSKRVILSAKPHRHGGGGDFHHTRDLVAAAGAAVVWLDTREEKERDLLRTFFADMKAGDAVALGWYATERSGISTASEFGIGTLPSDFFNSATVYAGSSPDVSIPPVPKMPELENKAYVAIFISDGDNIQYVQHAMRRAWDNSADVRGKVPLSWTIAPGLVDVAPAMLDYYYKNSTPADCFVTGPSGMGYIMPFNTLEEPAAPVGENLKDRGRMDGYARLTETYLRRSGLRVATIWDDLTPMQRSSYEENCRHLYGVTVQNFKDAPGVKPSVEGDRLRFEKLIIPYAGSYDDMHRSIVRRLQRWDGKSPIFMSYQVEAWASLRPDRILALQEQLEREHPGVVRFVRADHYFNLHNAAGGVPYNLSLDPATVVTTGGGDAAAATDGTPSTRWSAEEEDAKWIALDFGAERSLSRFVARHGSPAPFVVETSADGETWEKIHSSDDGGSGTVDVDLPGKPARHFRLTFTGGESPGLDDLDVYGVR